MRGHKVQALSVPMSYLDGDFGEIIAVFTYRH